MPQQQQASLKCVENILFFGLFILVGHLGMNFWEKNMIRNEVINMKFSLFRLKDTVNKIGSTYDQLHNELKEIAEVVDETVLPPIMYIKEPKVIQCKDAHNIMNQKFNKNNRAQTVFNARNHVKIGTKHVTHDKTTNFIGVDPEEPRAPGKNATTITRYPLKSTGVISDISKYGIESIWDKYYAKDRDTITNDI